MSANGRRGRWGFLLIVVFAAAFPFGGASQSPCAFTPAESHFAHFNVQASFQWFQDQFSPPRTSTSTGTLLVDSTEIVDSATFGWRLDGKSRVALDTTGLDLSLTGSGNLKRYLENDTFGIGALNVSYDVSTGLEGDLTGGLGIGRFRDVTPLAKAIRIQNQFLDEGTLLGPLPDDLLQQLAQTIGEVSPSAMERLATIEREIEGSGLVQGGSLGALALLEIEDILASTEEARLCGWEVQARVGLAANAFPRAKVSEALALTWNLALVPDPVSQWGASANWTSGLNLFERYSFRASLSYGRRISGTWRIRARYDLSRDQSWTTTGTTPFDHHQVSATLLSQLSPKLSLTVNLELDYETGYERPTMTLTVQLSYDVL